MDNKFQYKHHSIITHHTTPVITGCCMPENCQTTYYNRKFFMIKVCSYKLLMTVFVYNCQFAIKCFYLFRSQANSNCLFLALSIVMYGDNRYVGDLKILTAIKLYLKVTSTTKRFFFFAIK